MAGKTSATELLKSRFPGGIHLQGAKERTAGLAIVELPPPQVVRVPLSQHVGAPAKVLVNKGDVVAKGQVIGEPSAFISAYVHASIAGKVNGLVQVPHPVTGAPTEAVEIEREGEDRWAEGLNLERDVSALSVDEIRRAIHQAGIVGMGGAAFPTQVKLSPPDTKPIDTVIINGAECEPYLTADHRLMLESPEEILAGARIIMQVLGARRIYIAIEANKPDAYELLREKASAADDIVPLLVQVIYPQGGEKQLIKTVLDREVPIGGLPMDVAVVVQNVGTAAAIYQAVCYNRPLVERVVTVTGPGVEKPGNFRVRIGTPIGELLRAAGVGEAPAKVVLGGPMMGVAQASVETPVTKGTSGVLVLTDRRTYASLACIRCGRCVEYCVMRLVPSELSIFGEEQRFEEAEAAGVMDCIECGCCTYVCPAKRPIGHYIKFLKAEINKRRAARKSGE